MLSILPQKEKSSGIITGDLVGNKVGEIVTKYTSEDNCEPQVNQ